MNEHEINFFGFHENNTIADVRQVFSYENLLAEEICKKFPTLIFDSEWTNRDFRTCIYEIAFKLILPDNEYKVFQKLRPFIRGYSSIDHISYVLIVKPNERNIDVDGWESWRQLTEDTHLEPDTTLKEFRDRFLGFFERPNRKEYIYKLMYFRDSPEDRKKIFTDSILTNADLCPFSPDTPENQLCKSIHTRLQSKKALVLTGAPGTGKTYHVQEYADFMTGDDKSRQKLVQFHPSYDYTDFVEGLRPAVVGYDENEKPVTQFVRMDGQFKALCRKAAEREKLYKHLIGKNDYAPYFFQYYLMIDEINRAELSRVFGELMYCMEYRGRRIETQYHNLPTYRIAERNGKSAAEPIPREEDVFAEGFYIPENVYIIGTMNDIDRSVDSFDFALRRRFEWYEVKAADTMQSALEALYSEAFLKEIVDRAGNLNTYITEKGENFGLGDAYHLGQAYFRDCADYEDAGEYFDEKLHSILLEYVRGRKDEKVFLEGARQAFCAVTEDRNAPED